MASSESEDLPIVYDQTNLVLAHNEGPIVMKIICAGVLMLGLLSCGKDQAPPDRYTEAIAIIRGLVERDSAHPIHEDHRTAKDKSADRESRRNALARDQVNRDAFVRLREIIEVGRPLQDYSPIERLGTFVGQDPFRFFHTGFVGDVLNQGPEPYSVDIEVNEQGIIKKVTRTVASH